jgi:hypothetical protein
METVAYAEGDVETGHGNSQGGGGEYQHGIHQYPAQYTLPQSYSDYDYGAPPVQAEVVPAVAVPGNNHPYTHVCLHKTAQSTTRSTRAIK